jgi:PAS domain S-box-containing protein
MFGRPREFFVGRTLHDLYANTPRGIPAALEVRRRIFAGEEVRGEELEARRADGSPFWIRVSVSPEFDGDGHALGGRIMAIDLSTEKRAEQAVRVSEYLAQEIRAAHNVDEIVGHSPVLMGVLEKVRLVAETDTSVLILGETGTGKELIARALHSASRRKNRPLIKVNCAALPSGLIESELFGHEKGAFTGASERRVGRFELADGGTIFLDEIGEVPPDVQVKLLRVLQEREIERVGGNKTIGVDVRVVAATNRDLKGAVAAGKFRQDLFYRLNVFPIDLPPLRERPEDIRLLVHYFVGRYATKIGRRISRLPEKLLERLLAYTWPGNVRELENVIERAVILSKGPELEVISELPASISPPAEVSEPTTQRSLEETAAMSASDLKLTHVERDHILTTLKKSGWRIEGPTGAAHLLGLNPSTLRSRMKKLGIERSREALS